MWSQIIIAIRLGKAVDSRSSWESENLSHLAYGMHIKFSFMWQSRLKLAEILAKYGFLFFVTFYF